jgi:hypothetical protein
MGIKEENNEVNEDLFLILRKIEIKEQLILSTIAEIEFLRQSAVELIKIKK